MIFDWDQEKNKFLAAQRNISFERIVIEIEAGALLGILEHPNSEKYPNQLILMVNIDDYAWVVPVIKTKNSFFLKSASPSRKQTKHYLKKENLHETETD